MSLFQRDTFKSRLNKMSLDFVSKSTLVAIDGAYKTLYLPDPRRVWVAISPDVPISSQFWIRVPGVDATNGISFTSEFSYPFILSVENSFAMPQLGLEAKVDFLGVNILVCELLYRGR